MQRSVSVIQAMLCCCSWAAGLPGQDPEPAFDLVWSAPERASENPGARLRLEAAGKLVTRGLEAGIDGAQAWSISIASVGCAIVDVTTAGTVAADSETDPAGLRRGGFEKTELTTGEGNEGAVSAIVLSFTDGITLEPAESPHAIVRVTIEGRAPAAEGLCGTWGIAFADNRQGSGRPVENKVTWRGLTFRPTRGAAAIEICAVTNCCTAPLNLIFQTQAVGQAPEAFAGDLRPDCELADVEHNSLVVKTREGAAGEARVHAGIVSQLDDDGAGVQGWSLSLSAHGALRLAGVTTDGTAVSAIFSGGFLKTELVDPTTVHPITGVEQGEGAVSAVVLSFTLPITLAPLGTATVLSLDLAAPRPQRAEDIEGWLSWVDLMRGSGQPVRTVATVLGETRDFCERRQARVVFRLSTEPSFRRCDPNNDGRHDIADPIWIVNELFRGGRPSLCQKAADCNADGRIDLADATYSIGYEFQGAAPPPAPFPDCGQAAVEDPLPCDAGSTECG
jgi:hypothetical protein